VFLDPASAGKLSSATLAGADQGAR
jgi:hypothetical protein